MLLLSPSVSLQILAGSCSCLANRFDLLPATTINYVIDHKIAFLFCNKTTSDGLKTLLTLATVVMVLAMGKFLCNTITFAFPGSCLLMLEATVGTDCTVTGVWVWTERGMLVSFDGPIVCCCCCWFKDETSEWCDARTPALFVTGLAWLSWFINEWCDARTPVTCLAWLSWTCSMINY